MTATTPHAGLPYPETTVDKVRQGAASIKALAEALDAVAAVRYCNVLSLPGQKALPDNTPTALTFDSFEPDASGDWSWNGAWAVTYNGPSKMFTISWGANLARNGNLGSATLRLDIAGGSAATGTHNDPYGHLGGCIPALLGPGATIAVVGTADDNTGNAGGAYDSAWLRIGG